MESSKQPNGEALIHSFRTLNEANAVAELLEWVQEQRRINDYKIERVPFEYFTEWQLDAATGNITHRTGRFYSIQGLHVHSSFGAVREWFQPIMIQPEVGILGFLAQEIDGVLHLLIQAKMEPGNEPLVQMSPTVQATVSNYTQAHGGRKPLYLEYFLSRGKYRVILDQIQSEQGTRFLRKRNRNIILEVPEEEQIPLYPGFRWMTLGQLHQLLQQDNIVNMNSRSVLGCLQLRSFDEPESLEFLESRINFGGAVFHSAATGRALHTWAALLSWFADLKVQHSVRAELIPLVNAKEWTMGETALTHVRGRFFSVVAVSVSASGREVRHWEQPLIGSAPGGIIAFLMQRKNDVLHFLVQGRVEPGMFDILEMAPTVQCNPSNYESRDSWPAFVERVLSAKPDEIRYNQVQSEEGGRFYQDQKRCMFVELDPDEEVEIPSNYVWMTLRQLQGFVQFSNHLNIEARCLLSCIGFGQYHS